MKAFSPATRRWFTQHFDGPTDAQRRGWPVIASGRHCLITAPTGSGKTLAAFLWAIDRLLVEVGREMGQEVDQEVGQSALKPSQPSTQVPCAGLRVEARRSAPPGTRVLYLSPLKALVVDIERNLRAPLAGITQAAAMLGTGGQAAALRPPEVAIRTGDTPARERQRQLKTPAEILVTTPESLYLILGSQAAATLSQIETVIVDEVHALAPTKRGAHLALSLERLCLLVTQSGNPEPQRIGLSATMQPLTEAARWLGGDRAVEIVDAAAPPRLDLRVSVPVPDMERPPQPLVEQRSKPASVEPEGGPILGELFAREQQHPSENRSAEKGLWSAIYPALLDEIMAHRSTIIFVNSRGLCERLSQRLNALAAEPAVEDDEDRDRDRDVDGVDQAEGLGAILDSDAAPEARAFADEGGLIANPKAALERAERGHDEAQDGLDSDETRVGRLSATSERKARRHWLDGIDEPSAPLPELVRAHHGSVSHQQRSEIEEGLKRGSLKAIVATSSLEMGIDMGGVDQVLLVESPGSVARGLQRVGRAGHGVGEVSTGRIFPKYRGDLLECAVIAERMLAGELEPFRMPRNALDVLAQQLVAHCVMAPRSVDELLALVNRAGPYRELSRAALEAVLDMLSGRYPSSDFADLRPLLVWDRSTDLLSPRKGAPMVTRLNAGTIPDRGLYAVHLGSEGPRIGELDEEMVFETRAGECILLGASSWRVEEISRDRVIVSPAPGEPGKLPFWRGDGPGRPVELGRAVGAFCREVAALGFGAAPEDSALGALGPSVQTSALPPGQTRPMEQAAAWIRQRTPLDAMAADNLAAYIQDQREATGQVPSDRTIVVERFRDELGDWRICILSPFGARIHAPWAMALQWRLERCEGFEIQVMYTDDGIVLRLADGDALPDLTDLLPDPDEIEDRVTEQLADTALFASLFRENAGRALLLPRRSAKGRQPLWAQRLKAQNLLAVVRRYPAFPIVLETYRQALSDVFDLPGLKQILSALRSRAIRVHEVETRSASPFARSLVFAYVTAYIYEQDAPIAERRAQALTLDRGLLAELLGEAELRALIDPEVLEALERELQHLAPLRLVDDRNEPAHDRDEAGADADIDADPVTDLAAIDRRARDLDQLQDLLRRLGDLTELELLERCRLPLSVPAGAASEAGPTEQAAEQATKQAAEQATKQACAPQTDRQPAAMAAPLSTAVSSGGASADAARTLSAWLDQLRDQRRAAQVRIAGEPRWIAAEDAGLYRDALGCVPPAGLPEAFIGATEAPLEQLLRRYARTHGPFTSTEPAHRFGLRAAQLEPVLRLLESQGTLVYGEIRPNGSSPEWCDAEVMRQLRRRTLARARDQVAPVDGATLGRFLPAWHGIGEGRKGPDRLFEALIQLEGLSLSWRQLDRVLLPARVPGYRSEDLDLLAASGQIMWVGRGAAGPKDGRIAIYRSEHAALMLDIGEVPPPFDRRLDHERQTADASNDPAGAEASNAAAASARLATGSGNAEESAPAVAQQIGAEHKPQSDPTAAIAELILAHLSRRGACFLFELQQVVERASLARPGLAAGVRAEQDAFETALWDLVWDGRITNDTFAPLRSLGPGRSKSPRPRRRGRFNRGAFSAGSAFGGGLAGGRWSLVRDLAGVDTWLGEGAEAGSLDALDGLDPSTDRLSAVTGRGRAPTAGAAAALQMTERLLRQAQMLLERYGVLSREAVVAEDLPGGFGPLYKVLKQMEEVGQVRRGYFVEGLSGAQFALPAAIDRLRAARLDEPPLNGFDQSDVRILAAIDPANPYGALLPWPEAVQPGPKRIAGAWVILVAGKPIVYVPASGKQILTFPDAVSDEGNELELALAALPRVPSAGRKRLLIQHIDGLPALESPLREALLAAGFEADYDALAPARFATDRAGSSGTGRDPNAISCRWAAG
nr:DEAD/DEAH box helicase [Halochromatium roseum]